MKTESFIIALLLIVVALVGIRALRVSVRTSTASATSYPLEFQADRPAVSGEFVHALLLSPEQVKVLNESLAILDTNYRIEESKRVTKRIDDQGHVHVGIAPFRKELKALQGKFWSKADESLDERQRAMARERLQLRDICPYGDRQAEIELWRTGQTYHSAETTKSFMSSGSASGSGPSLSRKYRRFWEEKQNPANVNDAPAAEQPK